MPLNKKDLIEHERKLTEIIEHANKERDAIRILIEGMSIRDDESPLIEPNGKRMTIPEAVKKLIREMDDKPFYSLDITEGIVRLGVRSRQEWNNIRPTVSSLLRDMCDKGILERKDVGTENKKKYRYRIKKDGKLF